MLENVTEISPSIFIIIVIQLSKFPIKSKKHNWYLRLHKKLVLNHHDYYISILNYMAVKHWPTTKQYFSANIMILFI